MPEGLLFLAAMIGVPSLLALFVACFEWRAVFYAWLVWVGLLLLVFGTGTSNFGSVLYGMLLYVMFFSIIAVPVLTLIVRLVMRSRVKGQAPTT
ncbi:MAG: hypothetical protein AAGF29_08910 [Pseudomonadota bacterium]